MIGTILFWVSIVATCLGLLASILVLFRWKWVQGLYQEIWPKCILAIFRGISAIVAVMSRLEVASSEWTATMFVAAFGYLLWEFAGIVGDKKYKQAQESEKKDSEELEEALNDAYYQSARFRWLMTHIHTSLNTKAQRIRELIEHSASKPRIELIRKGLDPNLQVRVLLENLASYFRYEADPEIFNQNFRIGLFIEQRGQLQPISAFDLATRNHKPFTSFEKHPERYRLDDDSASSHAVRCIREGQMLIVENCEQDPTFEFFHETQKNYLKSMIAYPISNFLYGSSVPTRAALMIDTNSPEFFQKDDKTTLELILDEFVTRIRFEYIISWFAGIHENQEGRQA